jgi:hypothetical protein
LALLLLLRTRQMCPEPKVLYCVRVGFGRRCTLPRQREDGYWQFGLRRGVSWHCGGAEVSLD